LIDYIEQFARTYVFTTAMPPALAAATLCSLQVNQRESWRRKHLQALIATFREQTGLMGLTLLPSESAVQALVIGDVEKTMTASRYLRERGFQVSAIRPPTVPAGTARLRFTLSAAHTSEQLALLLEVLAEMAEAMDLRK